jgi:hypothetical protein
MKNIINRCPECKSLNVRFFRVRLFENEDGSLSTPDDQCGCDDCGYRGTMEEFSVEETDKQEKNNER